MTSYPKWRSVVLDCLDVRKLAEQHRRVVSAGAIVRLDRSDHPEEPLRVYADPAGHTFCLFTWTGAP